MLTQAGGAAASVVQGNDKLTRGTFIRSETADMVSVSARLTLHDGMDLRTHAASRLNAQPTAFCAFDRFTEQPGVRILVCFVSAEKGTFDRTVLASFVLVRQWNVFKALAELSEAPSANTPICVVYRCI